MLALRILLAAWLTAAPQGASPARFSPLPDNPCDLLTTEEIAAAADVTITAARRLPSIDQTVAAQEDAREPAPGVICSYETASEFGAITLAILSRPERSADAYWLGRARYFEVFRGSAEYVAGLGEDAWVSGGTTLNVLVAGSDYFGLATQYYTPRSRPLVLRIARAVLDKLVR